MFIHIKIQGMFHTQILGSLKSCLHASPHILTCNSYAFTAVSYRFLQLHVTFLHCIKITQLFFLCKFIDVKIVKNCFFPKVHGSVYKSLLLDPALDQLSSLKS